MLTRGTIQQQVYFSPATLRLVAQSAHTAKTQTHRRAISPGALLKLSQNVHARTPEPSSSPSFPFLPLLPFSFFFFLLRLRIGPPSSSPPPATPSTLLPRCRLKSLFAPCNQPPPPPDAVGRGVNFCGSLSSFFSFLFSLSLPLPSLPSSRSCRGCHRESWLTGRSDDDDDDGELPGTWNGPSRGDRPALYVYVNRRPPQAPPPCVGDIDESKPDGKTLSPPGVAVSRA